MPCCVFISKDTVYLKSQIAWVLSHSQTHTHTARRKRMCRVYNSNFFLYCMKQILTFSHLKIQQVRQITQINTDLIHSVVFFNRTSRTGVAEHALTESPLHSEVLFSPQINLLSTPCMWYHLWMQKEDYESSESKLSLVIFPYVIWKQYPQASLLWKKRVSLIFNYSSANMQLLLLSCIICILGRLRSEDRHKERLLICAEDPGHACFNRATV